MSHEAKKVLQKLTDELGHITLIADWAERQKKAIDEGTFESSPAAPVVPVPLAPAEAPPAPAADPVPAPQPVTQADVDGLNAAKEGQDAFHAGEAQADGNTAQTATSAQSQDEDAPASADASSAR